MEVKNLSLELIDVYGGTQARIRTNDDVISSYAEEMAQGAVFPPISVYFDGTTYWLADGFHRYLAAKRNESATIQAEVQPGGRVEALKHALGANATNGLYRSSADKRNAVEIALEEWSDRSNTYIAEICRVSGDLVRRCREEMVAAQRIPDSATRTGRDGRQHPSHIEREPRGKSEAPSSDGGSGGGGGGRGRPAGGGDGGSFGGTTTELELEARAMIRKGEMNPFELPKLISATAHDYAESVVTLLGKMRPDDPKRTDGLLRIRHWIDKALGGEV